MKTHLSIQGKRAVIDLPNRFDLNAHLDFHDVCEEAKQANGYSELVLNFSGVDYIDSSALGMLIVLHRDMEERRLPISLSNCNAFTRRILNSANFQALFDIT